MPIARPHKLKELMDGEEDEVDGEASRGPHHEIKSIG